MKAIKWIVLLAMLVILSVFVFFKPSRVLIPEINDVVCATGSICMDDLSRLREAETLLADAVLDVERKLGKLENFPKAIFCATQACYEKFGFRDSSASAVGKTAIVVGPRGWKPYYIKHELVHYWQAEKIGVIRMLFVDEWFKEGMAYFLSDDPRAVLQEPWQTYRQQFADWYDTVGPQNLPVAIGQHLQGDGL
jgi:hypothetical protein